MTARSTLYGQVLRTEDYGQFNYLKENRRINQRNYSKLLSSMKEQQLVIPILVNEKFQIIDGQHRFEACRELKMPVYYFIVPGYGISEVKRANMVSCNWVKEDFLNMHVSDNVKAYIEFKGLTDRFGISTNNLLKVFSQAQNINQALIGKQFEDGTFEIEGRDGVVEFLIALNDYDFFKPYKTTQFVAAFMKLFFHPEYDHSKMKERLKARMAAFEKKNTIDEYLVMLTKQVYSFGATKNPLYYDPETKRFYS